jgi:hypothetical protein
VEEVMEEEMDDDVSRKDSLILKKDGGKKNSRISSSLRDC